MSPRSASLLSTVTAADADDETTADAVSAPDSEELLSLLDAEYTLDILETTRADPKPARAIANAVGASRPTVYRRLNRLEDVGLVDSGMGFDEQGAPRTIFEATLDSLVVDVTDGFSVTVTTDSDGATADNSSAVDSRVGDTTVVASPGQAGN